MGTENDVIMIEGSAMEIPEEDFVKALEFAQNGTDPQPEDALKNVYA